MFFSLKDNVSYEETGTKYKRDREFAGLWVSGDSFCRFTAVYAGRTDNETDVEENGCVYAVVSGVCNLFLWNQSLQGGCPFRVSRLVYGAGDPGIACGDLFCCIPVL